jgi:hypothetical protein
MVLVDVLEDWLGNERGESGGVVVDLVAELGGADLVVGVGEED